MFSIFLAQEQNNCRMLKFYQDLPCIYSFALQYIKSSSFIHNHSKLDILIFYTASGLDMPN